MTAPPAAVARWVDEVAAWCQPAAVQWCDGSAEERAALCRQLVQRGTLIPLARPGSFLARSHPGDVARVESRTVICAATPEQAGPTNRWADPAATRAELRARFRGSMAGRTLYVLPFAMGPVGAPATRYGVQLTDSPYVALSMGVMTRLGTAALAQLDHHPFVPCWHSLGAPLGDGRADTPWPCDPERTLIAHFTDRPDEPAIWSFGSGYGGNALLGKKCLALRIASVLARREGWLAEHMLLLALTSPQGRTYHLAGAFPSACGKTNLAMLKPALPGWSVRCIGDDIAWLRIGADGRLRAINPEAGFFGVAPWTSWTSNPHGMATIAHDTIFTNTALTPDGDVWWEGMSAQPPAGLIDWQGRPWTPGGAPAAHPNARYTVPVTNCPILDPSWHDGDGVPIDALLFGGRRMATIPLVNEALSWEHGVFLGSTCASETTAAAEGRTGVVRHDPFAMLPFCGYHMGDYLAHWLDMGRRLGAARPRIYYVNWFRKGADGRWLWPGFSDNARVLAWIAGRLAGTAPARRTAVGNLPTPGAIDTAGLSLASDAMSQLTAIDVAGWTAEAASVRAFYATLGDRLPAALARELDQLQSRLAGSAAAG